MRLTKRSLCGIYRGIVIAVGKRSGCDMAECTMTEITEGTVEVHLMLNGVFYALGMRLGDFPTENALCRGLEEANECLLATLHEKGYWPSDD